MHGASSARWIDTTAAETCVKAQNHPTGRLGGGFAARGYAPSRRVAQQSAECSPRLLVRGDVKQGVIEGDMFSQRNGGALRPDYVYRQEAERLLPARSPRARQLIADYVADKHTRPPRLPPPAPLHAIGGMLDKLQAEMRAELRGPRAHLGSPRSPPWAHCSPGEVPQRVSQLPAHSPPSRVPPPPLLPPADEEAAALRLALVQSREASRQVASMLLQREERGGRAAARGDGHSPRADSRVAQRTSPPKAHASRIDGRVLPSIYNGMVDPKVSTKGREAAW